MRNKGVNRRLDWRKRGGGLLSKLNEGLKCKDQEIQICT